MGTIIDLSSPLRKTNSAEDEFSRVHFDTEIIRLQNYDNYYSLMDRLRQWDASGESLPAILLVWPAHGRILETPEEFGKLRGWCARHGYQAAVVIPKDDVRLKMAEEQGLPAFRTVQEAGESEWNGPAALPAIAESSERIRSLAVLKKDAEQVQETPAPFGIRLLFFVLALIAAAAVFYAVLPQAKVDITPFLTRKSVNMNIWTDDRLDEPTIGGGIPTAMKKIELSLEAVVPSSGTVQIDPGISIGEVIIRNTCDRTQSGSAGTVLSTAEDTEAGIQFITLEGVSVPPGEERTVRIEALSGGANGNLPAGTIRYAAYPQSLCWEIRQESATSGGTDGIYPAPAEADRFAALQLIREQVPEAVQTALQNDPEGPDLLPLGEPVVNAVKQEQMLPEAGFVSDTLTLRQTLEISLKTVRRSDIESIIRGQSARLNAQAGSLTGYEILSGPVEENGLSVWSVRAEYLVYEPETNEEALQILLRGKTIPQAQAVLRTLEHVKESHITLLPSWLKHMPLAAQNIRVTIHPAAEAEEP